MSGIISTNADWYLMRSSGFVCLILLTASTCLGIANLARLARGPWTRTVAALVHRNTSLLAMVFLGVHVLTAISDRYVDVSALSIVVPGVAGFDPLWTGLGALAVDLLIAVVITSLLRARLRYRSWQLVHWLAYLSWPSALIHSIGSGSGSGVDTGAAWSTAIYVVCGVAFAVAVAARLVLRRWPGAPTAVPSGRPTPRYAAGPAALPDRRPEPAMARRGPGAQTPSRRPS